MQYFSAVACDRNEALTSGMRRLISAEHDIGVSDSNKKGRSTEILLEKIGPLLYLLRRHLLNHSCTYVLRKIVCL